jgi:hypothetical protein
MMVRTACVALAAIVCSCSHTSRSPTDKRPAPQELGCYKVLLASRDFGSKSVYPSPPEEIALLAEPAPPGFRVGYKVGVPNAEQKRAGTVAVWTPDEGGNITVFWGRDFSGVEFRMKPTTDGFKGTAARFSDLPQPPMEVPAEMHRVQCAPNS